MKLFRAKRDATPEELQKRLRSIQNDKAFWRRYKKLLADALLLTMPPVYIAGVQAALKQPGVSDLIGELDEDWKTVLLDIADTQVSYSNKAKPTKADLSAFATALKKSFSAYLPKLVDELTDTATDAIRTMTEQLGAGTITVEQSITRLGNLFSRNRAELIAVTETTRVFGQGAVDTYAAAGLGQWEWRTVNDQWVSQSCESADGSLHSVEEPFQPKHPRCRCFAAPVTKVSVPTRGPKPDDFDSAMIPQTERDYTDFFSNNRNEKWAGRISDRENEAIRAYQREYGEPNYKTINGPLRAGEELDAQSFAAAQNLDKAIADYTLDRDLTVFRGFDSKSGIDLTPGFRFTDNGYVSTSVSYEKANGFAGLATTSDGSVGRSVIRMILPENTNVAPIDSVNFLLGEREMLLPRGRSFEIIGESKLKYTDFTGEPFEVTVWDARLL